MWQNTTLKINSFTMLASKLPKHCHENALCVYTCLVPIADTIEAVELVTPARMDRAQAISKQLRRPAHPNTSDSNPLGAVGGRRQIPRSCQVFRHLSDCLERLMGLIITSHSEMRSRRTTCVSTYRQVLPHQKYEHCRLMVVLTINFCRICFGTTIRYRSISVGAGCLASGNACSQLIACLGTSSRICEAEATSVLHAHAGA